MSADAVPAAALDVVLFSIFALHHSLFAAPGPQERDPRRHSA